MACCLSIFRLEKAFHIPILCKCLQTVLVCGTLYNVQDIPCRCVILHPAVLCMFVCTYIYTLNSDMVYMHFKALYLLKLLYNMAPYFSLLHYTCTYCYIAQLLQMMCVPRMKRRQR